MKITSEWLKEKSACSEGMEWFSKKFPQGAERRKIVDALVKDEHFRRANWFIVRTMTKPQYISYAIYAAEQVLDLYEKKYPNDKRPRKAIEAAKAVLKNDTEETRKAAYAADAAVKHKMRLEILNYGIKLISKPKKKGE